MSFRFLNGILADLITKLILLNQCHFESLCDQPVGIYGSKQPYMTTKCILPSRVSEISKIGPNSVFEAVLTYDYFGLNKVSGLEFFHGIHEAPRDMDDFNQII